jgi:hypothetical protein
VEFLCRDLFFAKPATWSLLLGVCECATLVGVVVVSCQPESKCKRLVGSHHFENMSTLALLGCACVGCVCLSVAARASKVVAEMAWRLGGKLVDPISVVSSMATSKRFIFRSLLGRLLVVLHFVT